MTRRVALAALAAAALGSIAFVSAARAADYTVYSPLVEQGENELEARGYNSWGTNEASGATQSLKLAFGRGMNAFWATEVYATSEKEGGNGLRLNEFEWENRFQLTPQGKYWLDVGLINENEYERGGKYKLKFGPILGKDFGRFTALLDVLLSHEYGNGADSGIGIDYRARLEYRWRPALSPLVEAYGEPAGRTGAFGEPRNLIGPGMTGRVSLGSGKGLRWAVVTLFGTSNAAADTTLVGRFEYEFF